ERQADYDHDEGRQVFVHQNLVDDDLEEEWRDESKKLDEQGRNQNMRQRPAISPNRRKEPAEAERLGINARAAEPARDQDHLAGPKLAKFRERHVAVGLVRWKSDTDLTVRPAVPDDAELAILEGNDRG